MRLLLAVDLNHHAEDTLAFARQWAVRLGARLDLAYVDEYQHQLFLVQDPAVRTVLDDQWVRIQADNAARLGALVASLPEEIRGEAVYLTGRAADEIVEAASTRDAVLLGTQGRTGLGHALLGSVAERVVRRSTVPVITFRVTSSASGSSSTS